MVRMKRSAWIAVTLLLTAMITSGCYRSASEAPVVTSTPIDPNSLFATPIVGATEISDVQIFGTQTAQAANPGGALVTASPSPTGAVVVTTTATPGSSLPVTPTVIVTSTLALPSGPTTTPVPAGSRPSTYTLQSEEFPYCIARRYNLDPDSLLAQNQLSDGTVYYAGVVLNLSNVASPFPGVRALRSHPTTYTVTGNADTTVYGVACQFGDIEPSAIVSANSGISIGSALSVGQTLNIP